MAFLSQKNKTVWRGRKSSKGGLKQKPVAPLQAAPDESQDIIASVQCILDREHYFVREIDRYLRHNDFLNLRKKEMLYKKWLEDVSEPLLQKIEDKMDSQSSEEIRRRNDEQLSLYLNYCKKKGFVALETYDPSEYDPFFLKTHTDRWKVSVSALQDPLLQGIQRKFIEAGVIKQCETGRPCSTREVNELSKAELPLLPLSRQHMDSIAWLKIPYLYIASEVYKTNRKSSATKTVRAYDVTWPPADRGGGHNHQKGQFVLCSPKPTVLGGLTEAQLYKDGADVLWFIG